MQSISPNRTDNQPRIVGPVTPEIAEALRTLRAADFQLESEFHPFGDWESREELADDLRAVLDGLDEQQADEVARVIETLEDESEDVNSWPIRTDASARIRRVVRSIESTGKEATANV